MTAGNRRTSRFLWLTALMVGVTVLVCTVGYNWWEGRLERSQDEPIHSASLRYNVDPALVKAIVWRESRFNPSVRGRAGEIGLMQIREDAAREWADAEHITFFDHEHCLDPVTNTLAGTYYLSKLMARFAQTDDPRPYALAAYNAGRGNALKWNTGAAATNSTAFIAQIRFPGTRAYVTAILERQAKYKRSFNRFGSPSPVSASNPASTL